MALVKEMQPPPPEWIDPLVYYLLVNIAGGLVTGLSASQGGPQNNIKDRANRLCVLVPLPQGQEAPPCRWPPARMAIMAFHFANICRYCRWSPGENGDYAPSMLAHSREMQTCPGLLSSVSCYFLPFKM